MLIPRKFTGETAIVSGTGPSLTPEVIATCNQARKEGRVKIFAANRAIDVMDADVFHACNWQFYEAYYEGLKDKPCDKWTTRPELEGKYEGVNYIEERWEPGLSKDPSYIHAHHGTGPQLVNIAYLYGCTRLLLVGWDMRYLGKTGPNTYARRRYLDEDPLTLNHWPRSGPNGEMEGLIREMNTIKPADYGIEIINCSPGSAMKCFQMGDLNEEIRNN